MPSSEVGGRGTQRKHTEAVAFGSTPQDRDGGAMPPLESQNNEPVLIPLNILGVQLRLQDDPFLDSGERPALQSREWALVGSLGRKRLSLSIPILASWHG